MEYVWNEWIFKRNLETRIQADVTQIGWRKRKKDKKMQEMGALKDVLNCQFYKTGVTKVNCYRYRRRQRFTVYRRHTLITKTPRGDKVIIEHEKKKIRLVAYLQNHMLGIAIQTSQSGFDIANARKRSLLVTMERRDLFNVRFIFSF